MWLECPTFAAPSRLPANVAHFLRDLTHERRRLVDLPEPDAVAVAA